MTVQHQFVPNRPRRARTFRHLWRPLRRRDADAAHPRARESLHTGEGRSRIPEGNGRASRDLCRPAIAALFRRAAHPTCQKDGLWPFGGRRENLFQARRAQPHRRAQGEQCAWPDHAGLAHGQDAHHCRDRCRHAWRCHRHALRQVRTALHRLHGRRRRRAAEAERAANENSRRRGAPGQVRCTHAQGCHERSAARLGDQCQRHVLLHRHGRRAASLSGDGA